MLEPGQNMMVPPDPLNPQVGVPINSIADYGRTSLAQVTAWESTFINNNDRRSQNSKMMYDLLMNSLSTQGIQRIQVWQDQYHLNQEDSGGCLLKVIIRESYLDSNATVSTLRLNLSSLDEYIKENGSDLVAFNAYVQSQVDGLAARGQTTMDLVVNLFKAYAMVTDQNFQIYIQQIENQHDDGTAEITGPELMQKAVNFYKKALTRKEWEQPSKQQKEVLALQAQLESLKKVTKKVKFDAKTDKKGKQKGKGNAKHNQGEKSPRPEWLAKNLPPKDPASQKHRLWKNLKWYWCAPSTGGKCDGKWRCHSPTECKGISKQANDKKPMSGNKRKASSLKIATVNASLAENADPVDEGEQEDSDYEN
jgi:hypothetical protein